MLARNETILKWALYAAATVLCLAVQEMFFQRFTLIGERQFRALLMQSRRNSPSDGFVVSQP